MSCFPREMILSFQRNLKQETEDSGQKWSASIYGRRNGGRFATVFVPDAASRNLPANSEQYWRCTVGEEPRFRNSGLELFTVDVEELVWECSLDLTFEWVKAPIPGGFRYQWQCQKRMAGGRLTTFVVDRRVVDDPQALKPTEETVHCDFRCRIVKQVWASDNGREQVLAVRPLKQLPPPPPIPAAVAVARLAIADEIVLTKRPRPAAMAKGKLVLA